MIRLTLALCVALAAAPALAGTGLAANRDAAPAPVQPADTAPTDLDLDPTFANFGIGVYEPPPILREDHGLRTQPFTVVLGGQPFQRLAVLARHKHDRIPGAGNWDAVVIVTDADGAPIVNHVVPTPMTDLYDAVFDPASQRAWFVGTYIGPNGNYDMLVQCVDTTSADLACASWGSSTRRLAWDLDAWAGDVAQRIAFDAGEGALYIAGKTSTVDGPILAIAKLFAGSGETSLGFGNGGKATARMGERTTGVDHNVYDLVLSPANAPQGRRLYLAGACRCYSDDYGDADGFVLSLDVGNAAPSGGTLVYAEDDNQGPPYGDDVIGAITVLSSGKLALAGMSTTLDAGYPALLLARLDPQLGWDNAFCGSGICVKPQYLGPFDENPVGEVFPSAIAERPGNHDLVVAMRGKRSNDAFDPAHMSQIVEQFDASGRVSHARATFDFMAASLPERGADTAGMLVGADSVLLTGSRRWSADGNGEDYDVTDIRLRANDSLFASGFGNAPD